MLLPRTFLAFVALTLAACSAASSSAPQTPPASVRPTADASEAVPSEAPASTQASASARSSEAGGLNSDPLHAVTLTDVRTGEQLTLGQLAAEKPLLVETMAIWCTNCRAQMHNVVAAHQLADFHSVSLDVEPGELPEDLARYAEREGFDWPFAMADGPLIAELRQRFGTAVAVPPSMPKILFRTDGSVELIGLGQLLSPEEIAAAVGG
jgi:hypothetical protein